MRCNTGLNLGLSMACGIQQVALCKIFNFEAFIK